MNAKNLPAKLLAILAVLFAASIICTTMPALDPVRYVEADATATAIAPALYPTVAYNENVLPTQQAVEAKEIKETTEHEYKLDRIVASFVAFAKSAISLNVTLWITLVTTAFFVAVVCYSIERWKRAKAYEPIQVLPDRAWYIPRERQLGDTRSGIGLLPEPPTAREHSQAVRSFQWIVIRSFVESLFDAVRQRKVTQWQPVSDTKEIVVQ